MRLPKEVFVALAAIAWADGRVDESERVALLAAARTSGLAGPDLDAVRAAIETKTDLAELEKLSLPAEAREYVYAVACWLTRADDEVTASEVDALRRLASALGISEADAARAELVSTVMASFDGPSSSRDLKRLSGEIEIAARE